MLKFPKSFVRNLINIAILHCLQNSSIYSRYWWSTKNRSIQMVIRWVVQPLLKVCKKGALKAKNVVIKIYCKQSGPISIRLSYLKKQRRFALKHLCGGIPIITYIIYESLAPTFVLHPQSSQYYEWYYKTLF